jgi:hypothetical protein
MTKATWQMTKTELARVFAEHFGWRHSSGGWIVNAAGEPICQGWENLADALTGRGWIRVGEGVNWRRAGERPKLGRDGKRAI